MILVVTYDLKKPGKDYAKLYETLKKASAWWHYLESTWLLKTDLSPNKWADRVRSCIDENDNLFIVKITSDCQGWLPKAAWDWIHKNQS